MDRSIGGLCVAVGLLLVAPVAHATEWYVDAAAGAGGSGHIGAPFDEIADANAAVQPGDTVYIKGGGSAYTGCIQPAQSGASGSPITYRAWDGNPDPVITGGLCTGGAMRCLSLYDLDYIYVSHIECDAGSEALSEWAVISNGSHNRIEDSVFEGTPSSDGVHLFVHVGGVGSDYNALIGNVFDPDYPPFGQGTTNKETLLLNPGASHTLVEGNMFLEGEHNTIQVLSSHNVLRRNLIAQASDGRGILSVNGNEGDPAEENVIEGNEFTGGPDGVFGGLIKARARRMLIRGNTFHDSDQNGIRIVQAGADSGELVDMRVYQNTVVRTGLETAASTQRSDGLQIALDNQGPQADLKGTEIVNNVLAENNNSNFTPPLDVNTAQIGLKTVQDKISGSPPVDPAAALPIQNNVLFKTGSDELIYQESDPTCSTVACVESSRTGVVDNRDADPKLRDSINGDFRLRMDSPAIEAGRPLAAVAAASTGNQVEVDDSWWFFGGFGVAGEIPEAEEGDWVRFGTAGLARVESIDRSTHTLTLDRSVNVAVGETVSIYYPGAAPDAGAEAWTHLIDEDFESYTVSMGGDNDPVNPGEGNTNDWEVFETGRLPVQVQVDAASQLLRVAEGSQQFWSLRRAITAPAAGFSARPIVRKTLRLRLNDLSVAGVGQIQLVDGWSTVVTSVEFETDGSGGGEIRAQSGSSLETLVASVQEGDWYQIVATLDLDANAWDVSVEDLDGPGGPSTETGLALVTAASQVTGLRIRSGDSSLQRNTDIDLDAIEVESFAVLPPE